MCLASGCRLAPAANIGRCALGRAMLLCARCCWLGRGPAIAATTTGWRWTGSSGSAVPLRRPSESPAGRTWSVASRSPDYLIHFQPIGTPQCGPASIISWQCARPLMTCCSSSHRPSASDPHESRRSPNGTAPFPWSRAISGRKHLPDEGVRLPCRLVCPASLCHVPLAGATGSRARRMRLRGCQDQASHV